MFFTQPDHARLKLERQWDRPPHWHSPYMILGVWNGHCFCKPQFDVTMLKVVAVKGATHVHNLCAVRRLPTAYVSVILLGLNDCKNHDWQAFLYLRSTTFEFDTARKR